MTFYLYLSFSIIQDQPSGDSEVTTQAKSEKVRMHTGLIHMDGKH
jgi:hypothetical protein